ncbi:Uncharacterised protein [Vibrio cholerae]|uniref:Uncharacterized protein n=1 Tax=Vibrio cholerae TaxID=666 RepID=A0A655XGT5_VIBCL|nr:Uncharacterised protein [Vibrio cholerae]CSC13348.1 Uncharacterised protein [Vibrio cholerae]CSC35045.1 Uncharacterised protein [Vibrio cholerae]
MSGGNFGIHLLFDFLLTSFVTLLFDFIAGHGKSFFNLKLVAMIAQLVSGKHQTKIGI